MNLKNIIKVFLFTFLIVSFVKADDMIDKEMMPIPSKKTQKSKLPLDYDKDSYLKDDIKYEPVKKRVSEYPVFDVDEEYGYVGIPNLKIGQSGIIVNYNTAPIIIAIAQVVESDGIKSKLEFKEFNGIEQENIPNSNLRVSNGDAFVLNYLYDASMIIAPNNESFQTLRKQLTNFDFLHSDLFAAYMKIEEKPIPTKELIQTFAKEQNLGSIFIVIEKKAYQIDSHSFKVLNSIDIKYEDTETMNPFYTRVEEIERAAVDFGAEDIGDYTEFYKELLELE